MCWWVVEAFASCPAFSTHPFHLFTTSCYVADQKMIRLNPTNKRWLTIRLFAKLPQPLVLDIITDFLGWKSLLQFQRRAAIWSKQRWHIQSSNPSSSVAFIIIRLAVQHFCWKSIAQHPLLSIVTITMRKATTSTRENNIDEDYQILNKPNQFKKK